MGTSLTGQEVVEKDVSPMVIAAVRFKGKYTECGKGFGQIGKKLGRYLAGPPFCLHYNDEYRENDAEFEACFPLREAKEAEGIDVCELSGGRCLSLMHLGPYDNLAESYARLNAYAQEHGHTVKLPTREIYHKGPGMFFKGNPKKYVTELQFFVESPSE